VGGARSSGVAQFRRNPRAARRQAGLGQRALGVRVGLQPSTIGRLERGAGNPRVSTVLGLAEALSTRPSELVRGIE
jgi:transcriptional regulator with XRE-family HTH domain